jgi:endonuclease/exonuclease/phosphatase (EEP) superfamily protein YafD
MVAGMAWLLLLAGDQWWPATFLLFGPRWVLALPLAALVPGALLLRQRRLLAVVGLSAGLVLGPVMGLCIPWRRFLLASPPGMRLRVLTCNMHYQKNLDSTPLDDLLATSQPDVVALQEWNESNYSTLLTGDEWHIHRTNRLFLASRYALGKVKELGASSYGRNGSVACYELLTPDVKVTLFSLHFASPRQGLRGAVHDSDQGAKEIQAGSELRWLQSEKLAKKVAGIQGPVLLVGDFNTPPESAIFRTQWGDWTNAFSASGVGWGYTFVARRTVVRIDHILAGKGWYCERCWLGPDVGSPHRPVLADLIWTGNPATDGEGNY